LIPKKNNVKYACACELETSNRTKLRYVPATKRSWVEKSLKQITTQVDFNKISQRYHSSLKYANAKYYVKMAQL